MQLRTETPTSPLGTHNRPTTASHGARLLAPSSELCCNELDLFCTCKGED